MSAEQAALFFGVMGLLAGGILGAMMILYVQKRISSTIPEIEKYLASQVEGE